MITLNFDEIYSEYFPMVYRTLLSLCRDPSLAEELTQETFYKFINKSGTFRGECSLSSWLIGIAKNTFISYTRKQRRFVPLEAEEGEMSIPDTSDVEQDFTDRELASELHRKLHSLPEPYREVFTLHVFAELTFAKIGSLFGKSEVWARVTYHRAKQQLKEDIQ